MSKVPPAVAFSRDGNVAVLTMQHPPHNLLGPALTEGLLAGVRRAVDDGCRAVVIRSAMRHFSAGADTDRFRNRESAADSEARVPELLDTFENLPLPIVASVHGVAIGGGFEIALACDFIVAAETARLGLVEATIGLHPLLGGIQRVIQRAGVARGKEIVMLARRHDPATLERWGIINQVVAADQLDTVSMALAHELAAGPTLAHAATKRLANIYVNEGMRAADLAMPEVQAPIWASDDLKIGLRSLAENGPGMAKFTGR